VALPMKSTLSPSVTAFPSRVKKKTIDVVKKPSFPQNEKKSQSWKLSNESILVKHSFDSKVEKFVDSSVSRHRKVLLKSDVDSPLVHVSSSFPSKSKKSQNDKAKPFLPFQEYINVVKNQVDCAMCSKIIGTRPPSEPRDNNVPREVS
jgi:hypothetical protein